MADLKEIYELAKTFAIAVDKSFESDPRKRIQFLLGSTEDELFVLLGSQLKDSPNGEPTLAEEPAVEDYLDIAEVYAAIAERTGKSKEFKQFVPASARTEEVQTALTAKAPAFAKLCM